MNFFKALFGSGEETPEEKQKAADDRSFDMFKYDGVRAARTGQFDYAVKCYREALKIKEDLEVRDYLAQALMRTGELPAAYEQLQKLAESAPDNQAVLLQMAHVAYMMEDYVLMSQACEKALLINNENAVAHYLYAQACAGQDDMINAVAMLTKAVTLDGDYTDAYLLRGRTLLGMGDVAGADSDVCRLMELCPENEDALMLKAQTESAKGDKEEAIATYDKVTELNPFHAAAYRERGAVRYAMGDMKGAQADMQKALEIEPEKISDINGEYSAEGVEQKVRQAYSNINPLGL